MSYSILKQMKAHLSVDNTVDVTWCQQSESLGKKQDRYLPGWWTGLLWNLRENRSEDNSFMLTLMRDQWHVSHSGTLIIFGKICADKRNSFWEGAQQGHGTSFDPKSLGVRSMWRHIAIHDWFAALNRPDISGVAQNSRWPPWRTACVYKLIFDPKCPSAGPIMSALSQNVTAQPSFRKANSVQVKLSASTCARWVLMSHFEYEDQIWHQVYHRKLPSWNLE